jgi:hypothetical protein
MPPSRNDPCPCGSGKKYKRCHYAHDRAVAAESKAAAATVASPEAARIATLKACDVAIAARLLRFARARYGAGWLMDPLERARLLHDGILSDAEMQLVIPWLLYCRVGASGLTLAAEWRRLERRPMAENDRTLLDAYASAWISLWEVAEVQPGTGSRLVDVLTREERFVRDVGSSNTLERFDTVLAMVLDCDGLSFFGGVHAQPLPPRWAELAAKGARSLCRVRTRAVVPDTLRNPARQLALLAIWNDVVDDMLHEPLPQLQNTDGDPLVFTSDEYELTAPRDEVARRLASLPGVEQIEEDEDGRWLFTVSREGNARHASWDNTIVARLALSATRLSVETNSARRGDQMRATIEKHLRGMARFRLRKDENMEQLMAEARDSAEGQVQAPRREEAVPPEALAALLEFREHHMRGWIDEPIPALGGLTPRQAAGKSASRSKLATLLKELAQSEASLPAEQRLDLRWLYEELGIPL